MRTADACELTLRVLAGLAVHNFCVLHLWWHPHLWGLQGGGQQGACSGAGAGRASWEQTGGPGLLRCQN